MLKRDMRLFLRGLVPAVILTCMLVFACVLAGMSARFGAERHTEPVKVALVDTEDSILSRISISMVTDQSYISSLMELEQIKDESTALSGMKTGKYSAVVVLPDGYTERIMHGEHCKGKIYISDAYGNEGELVESIADFGSRLLTSGQLGVFAGERVIAENRLPEGIHEEFLDNSNGRLITLALDAYDSVFSFEVLPYGNTGISMAVYYICCWTVLILFILGLFFPNLYISDCKGSVYSRLKTYGIRRVDFMSGKVIYPALFRIILVLIAIFAVGKINPGLFDNAEKQPGFIAILILVCISVSYITGNMAVALSKKGGWAVAILSLSAVFLFMAGGMVPRTMLPEILPEIVLYTPFGSSLALIIYALGGQMGENGTFVKAIIILFIYMALATVFAMNTLARIPKSDEEVRL